VVPLTRAEAGCLQYNLHQDNENPTYFLLYENWESRELWQDHMKSTHVKAFLEIIKDALAEFKLSEMTPIA